MTTAVTRLLYDTAEEIYELQLSEVPAKDIMAGCFPGSPSDWADLMSLLRINSVQTVGRWSLIGELARAWGPDTRSITACSTAVATLGIKTIRQNKAALHGWDDLHAWAAEARGGSQAA